MQSDYNFTTSLTCCTRPHSISKTLGLKLDAAEQESVLKQKQIEERSVDRLFYVYVGLPPLPLALIPTSDMKLEAFMKEFDALKQKWYSIHSHANQPYDCTSLTCCTRPHCQQHAEAETGRCRTRSSSETKAKRKVGRLFYV